MARTHWTSITVEMSIVSFVRWSVVWIAIYPLTSGRDERIRGMNGTNYERVVLRENERERESWQNLRVQDP